MDADLPQKAVANRAELQAVRVRISGVQQRRKLLEVTQNQVEQVQNPRVWQGVGRMFMSVSASDNAADTKSRLKELDEELAALGRKEQYYATTQKRMDEALAAARS